MTESDRMKKQKMIIIIIFSSYILILLCLAVFRFGFSYQERQINIALFVDLIYLWRNAGAGEFLRLFLGNICWFVPFGFLAPMLLKGESASVSLGSASCEGSGGSGKGKRARGNRMPSFVITLVLGLCFSFFIEAMQFIFYKGVAELDDLVLNTLGTAIGYSLFKLTSGAHQLQR